LCAIELFERIGDPRAAVVLGAHPDAAG
jgi:hypothetical protein